jgi:hypothetical protein
MLASIAAILSACSTENLPTISASEVASGQALPEDILPNGVVYVPYAG